MTTEYKLIKDFYGNKKAKRSKQPLIKHIEEGLYILEKLSASSRAMRAYCLHPMVQSDDDLFTFAKDIPEVDNDSLLLAMEYRNIANAYLSHRKIKKIDEIKLSPLDDVNDMLKADKIQNYKDFMKYHFHTHANSAALYQYFHNWFERLDININEWLGESHEEFR